MQLVASGGLLKSFRASSHILSRRRVIRLLSSSAFNPREDSHSDTSAGAAGVGIPHVPVLIVGAGPVGLVLSILLTKLGVECTVLEKRTTFSQHPQAHFINNRTMELFRKLDGLAKDIQRLQPPIELWRRFIYCTSLSGSVLGSVDHMQPQDCGKIPSPISVAHFSQYKLVNLLLEKLENFDFHVSDPDEIEGSMWQRKILMGHECVSIHSHDERIRVGVSILKEGKKEERMLSCSILIGCDGSRSSVRTLLNIDMKGECDLQKLVSVHFLSKDLGQYLLNERPGMLFFIFNPDAIGVLVAHDLNEGEFVLQIPYYPPQQKFEDFSSKVCEEIIFKLIGWKPVDLHVADIKPWTMHAEVAEKYVSHNNRVILVGDAAHRFPPAGGFGMNTGIQDAHNLAWKISSVFGGIASRCIIQTYEMERKPIAISNTALSVRNFKAAMSVPAALGLDPTIANSVHQAVNSSFGSLLPSGLQKTVLEGIFSIGRAQLSDIVLNANNPIGSSRLAKLKKIFDEGKSLQLQFPAEDLGFCYQDGALVSEGRNDKSAEVSDAYKLESRDSVSSVKPGSRLPHMNVRTLKASSNKDVFSTLDLIPEDKVEFLFIIGPAKESYDLACDMLSVSKQFRVPLKICIIWPRGSTDHDNGSELALAPWKNYVDIEETDSSSSNSWWEICNLTTNGVILVRPDEHIAWMAESNTVKNNSADLERLFSLILGTQKDPK